MCKTICTCVVLLLFPVAALAQSGSSFRQKALSCDDPTGIFCTEVYESIGYNGAYTGHDEPSPPKLPTQDGTGGTFNFQLHPAFWVGMAMCDDQSAPNPGGSSISPNIPCTPDSDSNIFDGSDPTKSDYIGKHPGAAFMEMQFYPPGWFVSCDTTDRWCSALNIDSLSENLNTGQGNNAACGGAVEYVNFALITKSGVPTGPPSPLLQNNGTFTPNADTLFYTSIRRMRPPASTPVSPGQPIRTILHSPTKSGTSSTVMRLARKVAAVPRMASTTWIAVFLPGRRTILCALTPPLTVFSDWYQLAAASPPISTLMAYRTS